MAKWLILNEINIFIFLFLIIFFLYLILSYKLGFLNIHILIIYNKKYKIFKINYENKQIII